MSPALNYKALLYATPTHVPSICPFTRPHVIISMHLPPVLWAWIRAPATHFLGARILTSLPLSIPPAAFSALPQHLPSPFSVIILSSPYLFQRGPIWVPVRCISSICHMYTTDFAYDMSFPGPIQSVISKFTCTCTGELGYDGLNGTRKIGPSYAKSVVYLKELYHS